MLNRRKDILMQMLWEFCCFSLHEIKGCHMPVTYFGKSSETDSDVDVFWRSLVGHSAVSASFW